MGRGGSTRRLAMKAKAKPKTGPSSRLRSLRRALAHAVATGGDVAALETQITALEGELEVAHSSARQAQQERQHALRYRKVKFFERQKATRRLRTLRKKLAGASVIERPRLSEELNEVLLDLEYIKHFPTTQRYIALYASAEDDPKTCQRRAEIREQVRARRQTEDTSTNEPERSK